MIAIKVNNQFLDLPSDTRFRIELQSPIFETDLIPASIIQWFDIPQSSRNNLIFENAHYISISGRIKEYPCQVFLFGVELSSAQLYLNRISSVYRIAVSFHTFISSFKDTRLPDFDYGGDISLGANQAAVISHAETKVGQSYPSADYTFPMIYNPNFYGDADKEAGDDYNNEDYQNYMNNYDRGNNGFYSNQVNQTDPDNVNCLVPMAYLLSILTKVFDSEGYNLFGRFMDDEDIQKLIIYNNYALDRVEKLHFVYAGRTSTQSIYGEATIIFDDDSTDPFEDQEGIYNNGTGIYTIQAEGWHDIKTVIEYQHLGSGGEWVPRMWVTIWVSGVEVDNYYVNGSFSGTVELDHSEWVAAGEVGNPVNIRVKFRDYHPSYGEVPANGNVKSGSTFRVDNVSQSNLNRMQTTMNLQDHLPEVTISEVMNGLKKLFGAVPFINGATGEIQIDFIDDIISSQQVLDLTGYFVNKYEISLEDKEKGFLLKWNWSSNIDFPEDPPAKDYDQYDLKDTYDTYEDREEIDAYGQVMIIRNTRRVYIAAKKNNRANWHFLTFDFLNKKVGNGKNEISSDITPIFMGGSVGSITPSLEQKGNSPAFGTAKNDFDLHLLFYHGMEDASDGDDYPFASPLAYDPEGNRIGGLELRWDGDYGLYTQKLKRWLEFLDASEEVTMRFRLDAQKLLDVMELFRPQRGKTVRKIRVGSNNYLPKKFNIIVDSSGVREAEAVMMKYSPEL